MTNLERRALLGDAEAQRECTEKGIVLGCPICGTPLGLDTKIDFLFHVPNGCALSGVAINNIQSSIQRWNTRPAPPIGRCGECGAYTSEGPGLGCCSDGTGKTDDGYCDCFYPKGGEENG